MRGHRCKYPFIDWWNSSVTRDKAKKKDNYALYRRLGNNAVYIILMRLLYFYFVRFFFECVRAICVLHV